MAQKSSVRGYNVWSAEEEEALRSGVKKHGLGAWEVIRRDPEFSVLENRTGVQLKDKFRNLVKFRHITQEESRTLKPKGSGPWSRKYAASGAAPRERSQPPGQPVESPALGAGLGGLGQLLGQSEEPEQEHAAALLALERHHQAQQQQLQQQPMRGQSNNGYDSGSEEVDDDGRRRKRRRSLENRRFGIYDQRRYRADGTLRSPDDERTDTETESDGTGHKRRALGQRSAARSSGGSSSQGQRRGRQQQRLRRRRNIEDSETTTEEDDDDMDDQEQQEQQGGGDDYIVDCPCGVRYDDGAMMVECEGCKVWAHVDCLQHQAASNPSRIQYDLDNYVCLACQQSGRHIKTKHRGRQGAPELPPLGGMMLPPLQQQPQRMRTSNGHGAAGMLADQTDIASKLLLQLSQQDPTAALSAALGTNGAKGLLPDASGLLPRSAASKGPSTSGALGLRSLSSGGMAGAGLGPGGLDLLGGMPGIGGIDMDSLSLFLNANRPGSALGNSILNGVGASSSPTKGGAHGGLGAAAGAAGASAGAGAAPSSPSKEMDFVAMAAAAARAKQVQQQQQLLNSALGTLLPPVALQGGAGQAGGGSAADAARTTSPNANIGSVLKHSGSTAPSTAGLSLPPVSVSALSNIARPPSRSGHPAAEGSQNMFDFSDLDYEGQHAGLAAASQPQPAFDSNMLQLLSNSRAPTPSQLFIESLLRGPTPGPDPIGIAPLMQSIGGMGGQNPLAATVSAAMAAQQLQMLQQQGLGGALPPTGQHQTAAGGGSSTMGHGSTDAGQQQQQPASQQGQQQQPPGADSAATGAPTSAAKADTTTLKVEPAGEASAAPVPDSQAPTAATPAPAAGAESAAGGAEEVKQEGDKGAPAATAAGPASAVSSPPAAVSAAPAAAPAGNTTAAAAAAATAAGLNPELAQLAAQVAQAGTLPGAAAAALGALTDMHRAMELQSLAAHDPLAYLRASTPTPSDMLGALASSGLMDPSLWASTAPVQAMLGAAAPLGNTQLALAAAAAAQAQLERNATAAASTSATQAAATQAPTTTSAPSTTTTPAAATHQSAATTAPAAAGASTGAAAGHGQQGAVAAAVAQAEAAAQQAAAAATAPAAGAVPAGAVSGSGAAPPSVLDMVDRKGSLGILAQLGTSLACSNGMSDNYFNVEDMLRSSTPALK